MTVRIVVEPRDHTAGVGIVHPDNPETFEAEYQIVQLWQNGDAETIHVGDREDAIALLSALADEVEL